MILVKVFQIILKKQTIIKILIAINQLEQSF